MAPVTRMVPETMSFNSIGENPRWKKRNVVGKREKGTTPEVKWKKTFRERGNGEWSGEMQNGLVRVPADS